MAVTRGTRATAPVKTPRKSRGHPAKIKKVVVFAAAETFASDCASSPAQGCSASSPTPRGRHDDASAESKYNDAAPKHVDAEPNHEDGEYDPSFEKATGEEVTVYEKKGPLRTRLNAADVLMLAQLCVEYQDEYYEKNKGKFWKKISVLLHHSTGKTLKDCGPRMGDMVVEHKVKMSQYQRESGTVQEDTELSQAMEVCVQRVDFLEEEEDNKHRSREDLKAERVAAEQCRRNLRVPQALKRAGGMDSGNPDEGTPRTPTLAAKKRVNQEEAETIRVQREQQLENQIAANHEDTQAIVGAVQAMASASRTLGTGAAAPGPGRGVEDMEGRITKIEEGQKEQGEMLRLILGHVAKTRASSPTSGPMSAGETTTSTAAET